MEDPNQTPPGQTPPPLGGSGQAPSPPAETGQPPLAIASLVTGILGILTSWCCVGWPLSIAAVVTGILGRKQAPERGVSPTMATIGLALGIAGVLIAIAWIAFVGLTGSFNADFDTS